MVLVKKKKKIRIISPSSSLSTASLQIINLATKKLTSMNFEVSFSEYSKEKNTLGSSSIESRLHDLHEAFLDKNVKLILCARGGYSSNDLLKKINYKIIKANPKPLCGYSDITVLANAIYKKTKTKTSKSHNKFYKIIKDSILKSDQTTLKPERD